MAGLLPKLRQHYRQLASRIHDGMLADWFPKLSRYRSLSSLVIPIAQ